ncbi:MAG: PEGA domain-containing protein [Brevinematales bacterium]|nr:PEGA domain-containing protein [Brevinematales bacterium]
MEKEKVRKLLFDFYAREYPILIFPFTNQSRGSNFAYLEEALPETVGIVLQSLEKEYTPVDGWEYVRLRGFPVALEEKILSARVSSWQSYKTLQPQMVTQVVMRVETNARLVFTNRVTNVYQTNVFRFATNRYEKFLHAEFPSFVEEVGRFPFSWRIEKPQGRPTNTNVFLGVPSAPQVSPEWVYEGRIYGRFTVRENKIGPSEVEIFLVLFMIKASTTNRMEMVLRTSEDRVYEEILKRRGEIRRFYLGGDLVDVEIQSSPEGANVYFDTVYVGRTPLVYEGVRTGNHRITFVKEGFDTVSYTVDVQKGGTNLVKGVLRPREMVGRVLLSGESNRLVFLDSLYVGKTPLVVSNISLYESHVLLVRSDDPAYEDVYMTFALTTEKPELSFSVGKGRSVASRQGKKNLAWGICYGSWGITLGFVGAHFYTSVLKRYYEDQTYNPSLTDAQKVAYASQVAMYAEWQQRLFTYGILSSLVSMGLTAYALSQEEVYLSYDPVTQRWGLVYTGYF